MLLGVNERNEIIAVDKDLEGLTVIEVDAETFADKNPLLYKIQAGENWQMIYPRVKVMAWKSGLPLTAGQIVAHANGLWEVIQGHTSQGDWMPSIVPALFKTTLPEGEIGEWKQPAGSHDAYNIGDKVWHGSEDMVYMSLIDANTWSPSAYPAGWKLV